MQKLFPLGTSGKNAKYDEMLSNAQKFNDDLDAKDLKNGHAPPSDCSPPLALRTAMSAISSGLQMED